MKGNVDGRQVVWLLGVVTSVLCATMGIHAEDAFFMYDKYSPVHREDTDVREHLHVFIDFSSHPENGRRFEVFREPSEIYGALGKTRVFQGARYARRVEPEELEQIKLALDTLQLSQLPKTPLPGSDDPDYGKYPEGIAHYSDVIRAFVLKPEATEAQKLDEAIEALIKKFAKNGALGRAWQPEQLAFEGDDQPAQAVTFVALIADPLSYHGKRVRVTGYYTCGFEESCLWRAAESVWKPGRELTDDNVTIWVGGSSVFADKKLINDKAWKGGHMVTMEGTFNAGAGGHMGGSRGEIERLTSLTLSPAAAAGAK